MILPLCGLRYLRPLISKPTDHWSTDFLIDGAARLTSSHSADWNGPPVALRRWLKPAPRDSRRRNATGGPASSGRIVANARSTKSDCMVRAAHHGTAARRGGLTVNS